MGVKPHLNQVSIYNKPALKKGLTRSKHASPTVCLLFSLLFNGQGTRLISRRPGPYSTLILPPALKPSPCNHLPCSLITGQYLPSWQIAPTGRIRFPELAFDMYVSPQYQTTRQAVEKLRLASLLLTQGPHRNYHYASGPSLRCA